MQSIKISDQNTFSRIIQGFWRLTDWNLTTDELVDFMKARIELGVTTFDTAEIYADTECERQMGLAFERAPELRQKIQLVSKTGIFKVSADDGMFGYYDTSYERIMRSCRESLKRLHCDSLDLYLIHREDPLLDPWETARALLDLQKQGLVRDIGVSNFDPFKFDALQKAVGGRLVTNQIEWNPVCFEHFRSGMMDYLCSNRIHPMIWSPLAGGRLFRDEQDPHCAAARHELLELSRKYGADPSTIVYAWILRHPVGALPLVGSQQLSRLQLAIDALSLKLERSDWYRIYAASGQQQIR